MPNYEIKVTARIVGYENLSAENAEDARKKMEKLLEEKFQFSSPTVMNSLEFEIEIGSDADGL